MRFIYFFLIVGLLFSCKKEGVNSNVSFPRTLYGKSITYKTPIRLFTNKKEIFDTAVINRFVKDFPDYFYLPNTPIDTNVNVKFITKDTALIGTNTTKLSVVVSNNQFLFYGPLMPIFNYPSEVDGIIKYVSPLQYDFYGQYLAKSINVGYGDYTNLDLSIISFKLRSKYSVNCLRTLNEFDENYVSKMIASDTLAVREFSYSVKAN